MGKQLVFSILQYLSSVSQSQREDIDVESLEVAIQCLGTAFALDVNDEAQKEEFATETSLKEIFKYGLVLDKSENTPLGNMLKQVIKTSENDPIQSREEKIFEEKFEKYLAALTEKGFFTGTQPGSAEYKERMEKARARLKEEEKKAQAQREAQAEEKKAEGNALLRDSKIDDAIKAYTEAIDLNPYNAIYYGNRAAAYTSLRDHESAIEDCRKAVAIDSTYSKAYSRMGLAFFSLGKYHEAVHAYEKAKELDPENETIAQSLEIAKKKHDEQGGGHSHGGHGHSHAGGAGGHGHSHGPAGGAGGMPDFSSMMNNPAIQNMMSSFQQGGAPPNMSDILSNPDMINAASQMMNNPQMSNLFNNPAIMNMASQMLSNPNMLGSMMSNFGGMGGQGGASPQSENEDQDKE